MAELETLEIIRRPVNFPSKEGVRPVQGTTAQSLIRALKEADQDAVVAMVVVLPNGQTMWCGVQGVLTDYDGTGACAALLDNNAIRQISQALGVK